MRQRTDLVFPMEEYERRLRDLRRRIEESEVDAFVTTTPENICYLTGFESPGHYYFQAVIVPLDGEPVAVPRLLEESGYRALTGLDEIHAYTDSEDPMARLADVLAQMGLASKRIGYEKDCWFFTAAQQERLFARMRDATFVDLSGTVEAGRLIKSDHEVDLMRRAARTTEAGMRAGIEAVKAGATENDVAAAIHYAMITAGSEWPSIAPFVAAGERGAIGHATWAGRPIHDDEAVMIEIGGCLKRYHAVMMRTVFVGEPAPDLWEAERVVHEAMEAMLEAIRPGRTAHEVDAVGRTIIGEAGFQQGSRSAYSLGIGLPPDWGEGQILSMQPGEERPLQANMTFHLLPWVQVPGKAGISFSETIRVTDDGCEILTNFPRKLFVR